MSHLRIHLFGKFSAQCDDAALGGLDACKVQELFSYLLIHRDRPHSREALAALLWGDTFTAKSKKYLRQALWQLQGVLGAVGAPEAGVLAVEHDWVQLNSGAGVWLDVAVLERASAAAQAGAAGEPGEAAVELLRSAAEVYRGDLLEGWYQDWCLYERERLQNIYLSVLDKLVSYCEAHRLFELGLVYGSQILRYDRARERTHRQLMSLQYQSGDRTAALRQYERCAAALDEELGVRPDRRTVALYQQIRGGQNETPAPAEHAGRGGEKPGASPLSDMLGQLRQIQTILADVQQRVNKEIKAVELALDKTS